MALQIEKYRYTHIEKTTKIQILIILDTSKMFHYNISCVKMTRIDYK
jgi:hypothetical protein